MIKKYFRYFYGSVIFLVILALLAVMLSVVFMPKNNAEEFGMSELEANALLGEDDNTIDIIVLGDSEAYSSISPMEIWNRQKITSFVCASSAQYLSYSSELLNQALRKQQPKIVILETNAIYREIKYENSLMTDLENTISILKYHDRWKNIGVNDLSTNAEYTYTDDNKGYVYRTDVAPTSNKEYMHETDMIEEITDLNQGYVKAMAEKCKENNVRFILLSTPSTKNWSMEKHNGIEALAQELDVEYIDLNLLNDKIKINWKKDTKDKGDHLNYSGAKKVSKYLGKYFKKECGIKGTYPDEVTRRWNEAYERYAKVVS